MTIYEFFPVLPKQVRLACWSDILVWRGCGERSDSSAQVLRNSRPGHPPPSDTTPAGRHLPAEFLSSVTTPAEMNWPAEFLDDLAGVYIIIIERNRLRANKMRKLGLLLRPARWYVFSWDLAGVKVRNYLYPRQLR